jgi:hypothetical protein
MGGCTTASVWQKQSEGGISTYANVDVKDMASPVLSPICDRLNAKGEPVGIGVPKFDPIKMAKFAVSGSAPGAGAGGGGGGRGVLVQPIDALNGSYANTGPEVETGDVIYVWCAFFGGNSYSRMPLDPTHVRFKRTCV